MSDIRDQVLRASEANIEKAFNKFAIDGEITLARLSKVMVNLGIARTQEQLEAMFKEADTDGSGHAAVCAVCFRERFFKLVAVECCSGCYRMLLWLQ